ncbi:MAG: thioredoxin fold domain-containing protein [Aquificaceae bacterium]
MMKWLFLLTLILLTACQQKTNSDSQVRDLLPQNQYAMLIVESESCIYCKQLRKDLQNQSLAGELQGMDVYSILYESNARVRYILNGQERISTEEELAKLLKVSSFPQIFFYDREGRVLLHLPGYQPPKTLACSIRYVRGGEYKKGGYMDYMKAQECL